MIRKVKKFLGKSAYRLLRDWPYIPLEMASARARPALSRRSIELPKLACYASNGLDLCMLLGAKHADMGLFAAWSLMRFLPGARLKVFSDGSLEESHRAAFQALMENVNFVDSIEREEKADAFFGNRYPLLKAWRANQIYGAKFTDFHLFGEGDRIVSIDSDILCFSEPTELIECLDEKSPAMRWNMDSHSSYVAPTQILEKIVGWRVPERVNSGFLTCRRWCDADWDFFENLLARMSVCDIDSGHFWAEQTFYAMAAGLHSSAAPFSGRYVVAKGRIRRDTVMRHYVGVRSIRPRFFLEGVPKMLQQIA
jgi:hypothetical protein